MCDNLYEIQLIKVDFPRELTVVGLSSCELHIYLREIEFLLNLQKYIGETFDSKTRTLEKKVSELHLI